MPAVFCWEISYPFVLDMSVWLTGVKRLVLCFLISVGKTCFKDLNHKTRLEEADSILPC